MKPPKLFQKDRFKHDLFLLLKKSQWLEFQHQLQKWFLVSTSAMYLRERLLISLNLQKFFLARSNAKSHSLFIWEVMFNLTFFWVKQYFPFPNTEI